MNKQKRTEIFKRWKKINPHPTTELEYSSAFELLIENPILPDINIGKISNLFIQSL